MASSFETHRFATLLRMRSQTLMVRSASSRVSNHEATVRSDSEFDITGKHYEARPALLRIHSIAKALETIATGLRSAALDSVTRPKLMVRPSRTTRASASTSEAVTARMKWVV